jgi:ribosomal protein S1
MRDFRDAKAMARTLREALAAKDVKISNSEALELTARMLGERDWNTLAAAIDASRLREATWTRLEGVHARKEPVTGSIVGRVRGGFTVDLGGGASAFLPGSQVDVRPVRDWGPLMDREHPFAILKLDRPAGHIVVSRRAILEQSA